jgi:hypothetical protein
MLLDVVLRTFTTFNEILVANGEGEEEGSERVSLSHARLRDASSSAVSTYSRHSLFDLPARPDILSLFNPTSVARLVARGRPDATSVPHCQWSGRRRSTCAKRYGFDAAREPLERTSLSSRGFGICIMEPPLQVQRNQGGSKISLAHDSVWSKRES